ncbi:type III toxin-antitoxin system TenpIN family toxin [Clostridium sp. Marseille-P299]|uniref:type III toxin-antitoxin system TenpIN family toxin n=1 Tax=Clostridium sp. Marseille-P299 TaxID=1805477 RepID=UPI0008325438|nr:hypothetical protein [Clostridium sp. Marseille-P299]
MDVVFIKEQFFMMNENLEEMLDPRDIVKQTLRQYLFLNVKYRDNNILIPLRSDIPKNNLKICYPVPSRTRPNAGLDYRKMLIINDDEYIEKPEEQRLANSQLKIITDNYETIKSAAIKYVNGYIKAAKKNRERKDYDYKFSTLHNFHEELGINSAVKEVAPTKEMIDND